MIMLCICLLGGLLASATPCVYPMVPITARILAGRGTGRRGALAHSGMYLLGIMIIYFVMGTVAAWTGSGFGTLLRSAWVILAFSLVFGVLALSTFGAFELALPASWTNRIHVSTGGKAGLLGSVLMGVGAGLVVSPCVGPILAAILLRVFDASGSLSAIYGGILVAVFGAGVGLPLFVVGLLSNSLPRPGQWMVYVKWLFGAVILAVGLIYLDKAMGTAGISGGQARALGYVTYVIFLAAMGTLLYRPASIQGTGLEKVRRPLGLGLLVAAMVSLCLFVVSEQWSDAHPGPAISAQGDDHGNLTWHTSWKEALAEAKRTGRPVFVDFTAEWCANCRDFSQRAARPGKLNSVLQEPVLVKIDYDNNPAMPMIKKRFPLAELRQGMLPFFMVLDPEGNLVWKGHNHRDVKTFREQIERASRHGAASG